MRPSFQDSYGFSLGGEIKYKPTNLNLVPKVVNLKYKNLLSYKVI